MTSPRFVLAIADYTFAHPDMPEDLPVCIYDRQARRIVLTIANAYANLICLETTEPGCSPFTSMVDWLNNTSADALESEGIPSAPAA